MLRSTLLMAALCSCATVYGGTPCAAPPTQQTVCESGVVSRTKLVNYVLDSCGVTRTLEASFANSQRLSLPPAEEEALRRNGMNLSTAERMLITTPCADGSCSKADADALASAHQLFDYLLNYAAPAFQNDSGQFSVRGYLETPNAKLSCGRDVKGDGIEAPGAIAGKPRELPTRLRVRGGTDSLFWSNKDAPFSSSDRGTLGSSYSSVNTTRKDKIAGVLGYALKDPMQNPIYNVFPYVGVNRDLSRPTGKPTSVSSNTIDYGFLNAYRLQSTEMTHWFTLRPDFLINHADDSHLLTANFTYTPFKNYNKDSWYLNDFDLYGLFGGRASFLPIADFRIDLGHYTKDGNTTTTTYENYWRAGPRVGFSIASESPYLPLDLTVTNLYMQGLDGQIDRLNYFKAVLSYKLVGKFIGIDLSFSHGRREDTGQPERLWGVALAGAY
jgi:hypothetical protein